jgi:hypothetical protein
MLISHTANNTTIMIKYQESEQWSKTATIENPPDLAKFNKYY